MYRHCVAAFLALISATAFCGRYSSSVLKSQPVLGHGFSPYLVKARKGCLTSPRQVVSNSRAEVYFDYHIDSANEKREILGEVSHGINLVLAKGKQSFKIRELFTSAKLEKTLLYKANYHTKTELVGDTIQKTNLGTKLADSGDFEAIRQNCGEEYIAKIHHGGRLYIAIRIKFLNEQAKQEVEQKIEGSALGIKKVITKHHYSEQTRENSLVSVEAMQLGGDDAKLQQILAQTDTNTCRLDQPDQCQQIISSLVDYATNTQSGFPAQLGQSPLSFETRSYYDHGFPELSKRAPKPWSLASEEALNNIADTLLDFVQLEAAARDKKAQKLVRDAKRHDYKLNIANLSRNILLTKNAAKACYRKPDACHDTETDLRLKLLPIDRKVLSIAHDTFWFCTKRHAPFLVDISKLVAHLGAENCDELVDKIDKNSILNISGLGLISLRILMPNSHLKELVADDNAIKDIAAISLAPGLRRISLRRNDLAFLGGLANHGGLEQIDLAHNAIRHVSALNGLPKLGQLNIYGNPVEDADSIDHDRIAVVFTLEEACSQRIKDYLKFGLISKQDLEDHPNQIPHSRDNQNVTWHSCSALANEL